MNTIINYLFKFIPLLIWFLACIMGGVWMVRKLFRLRPNEEVLVGIGIGLIIENWLVNFLGRLFLMPVAIWASALIVLLTGLLLSFPKSLRDLKNMFKLEINPWVWGILIFLIALFWGIGNGMAIWDEFQSLPLVSQMAAGDIPPHFPLDPRIVYNYHYYEYLFSAQLMRLGNLFPWSALDLQHALFLALSLILLVQWVFRITHNRWASIGSGFFYFFSGGTRWLMLVLPSGLINYLDSFIKRIGSGLNSGPNLQAALTNAWAAQGSGPYTIPFAFANGFNPATSIGLGTTNLPLLFLVLFLLTFGRWKDWKALGLYIILLASLALTHEITFVMILMGLVLVMVYYAINNRTIKFPIEIIQLLIAIIIAGAISLFQGGIITGIFQEWLAKSASSAAAVESYQNVAFFLTFPPAVVDAHLGVLSLLHPVQHFVLLFESGPMMLLLWPVFFWGFKALRIKRWFEAILIAMIVISLGLVFFTMSLKAGSIGSLTRAQNYFFLILKIFALPILFLWMPKRSEGIKIISVLLLVIIIFGGIVIFGLEMLAIQRPMLTTYIEMLDAKVMREFWDKLDKSQYVFDPERMRAAVVFGYPTDSSLGWIKNKPDWERLFNKPDPYDLQKAGFGYVYTDNRYLDSLPPSISNLLQQSCIKMLADYKNDMGGERKLLDIRGCQ